MSTHISQAAAEQSETSADIARSIEDINSIADESFQAMSVHNKYKKPVLHDYPFHMNAVQLLRLNDRQVLAGWRSICLIGIIVCFTVPMLILRTVNRCHDESVWKNDFQCFKSKGNLRNMEWR